MRRNTDLRARGGSGGHRSAAIENQRAFDLQSDISRPPAAQRVGADNPIVRQADLAALNPDVATLTSRGEPGAGEIEGTAVDSEQRQRQLTATSKRPPSVA